MPSGTFVPFEIAHFPEQRKPLKTAERRPRGSDDPQADPVYTELRFTRGDKLGDFEVARITHRKGIRVEGFWHGTQITELVQQKVFDAYFALDRNILVAHTAKEIALSAADTLTHEFHSILELRAISLDFSQIIPHAVNVIGSWFKGMKFANIRTEAAFGSGVDKDPEFLRLGGLGSHSNLIVLMHLGADTYKVNISKDGSTYFMDGHPIADCLNFVMHLLKYRITPHPPKAGKGKT